MNAGIHNFVLAMRQNGSLHSVISPTSGVQRGCWTEIQRRRIHVYCTRNEVVPDLVAHPSLGNDKRNLTTADLSLFPTLFRVAKQAPRTAPNSMLIGLLAAGDAIG